MRNTWIAIATGNRSGKGFVTPHPVFIIATYDENGNADAMNAAWVGQIGTSVGGACGVTFVLHLGSVFVYNSVCR